MNVDDLVDRFVTDLGRRGTRVERIQSAPWISALENRLSRRFPASYASLITRYRFPPFELGGVGFFGNTGDASEEDLAVAIFVDAGISTPALAAGLLQVGRPAGGSYDPVCFDTRGRKSHRECPIVQVDHEVLLQSQRIVVKDTLAESFQSFMRSQVRAA